jgi:HAD superfamily hydrolase (TIGR01549 family)
LLLNLLITECDLIVKWLVVDAHLGPPSCTCYPLLRYYEIGRFHFYIRTIIAEVKEEKERTPTFAAVIFDLGDTLVKTPWGILLMEKGSSNEVAKFESIVKVTYDSLVKSGIKAEWPFFYEKYMSVRAQQLQVQKQTLKEYNMCERVARTLSALGIDISARSELVKKAIEDHYDSYESYVCEDKEAPTTLRALRARYKLGLITNFAYPPTIYKLLERFRLGQFFDSVVISGEVGWVKPNPKIFQFALSALELKAEQCVFIGDDVEADINGAKGVGMKAILLSQKDLDCPDADAVIRSLGELESAIDEIERRGNL